jgi:hypothetical protein
MKAEGRVQCEAKRTVREEATMAARMGQGQGTIGMSKPQYRMRRVNGLLYKCSRGLRPSKREKQNTR